jgi:hypothetical protein
LIRDFYNDKKLIKNQKLVLAVIQWVV